MKLVQWTPGLAIYAARRSAGWSQERLAEELSLHLGRNVEQTTVSRMERDQRPVLVDELVALRDLFGLDLDWWVDGPSGGPGPDSAIPGQLKPELKPAA